MRVDKKSLDAILGQSKEVVVYGLLDCLYVQVKSCVDKMNQYRVHDVLDFDDDVPPFPVIKTDPSDDEIKQLCKAGITSVVIENYKRSQRGEPLIPIIFCVEMEEDGKKTELDVDRIAVKKGEESSVTDSELRRCFKTYHEMTDDIKKIARETFRFVCVKQDAIEKDLYSLQPVPPFWEKPNWYQLWEERTKSKIKKNEPKKHPWRDVQASEIKLFDEKNFPKANESNQDKLPVQELRKDFKK